MVEFYLPPPNTHIRNYIGGVTVNVRVACLTDHFSDQSQRPHWLRRASVKRLRDVVANACCDLVGRQRLMGGEAAVA